MEFFLENKINEKSDTVNAINIAAKYYKLPYIGHISVDFKRKINRFCKLYCKNLSIKIVLTPFKIGDMINVKDPILKSLKSFVVYKFVCPGCNACYMRQLAICQQGLRSTWKWIKSPTFCHILLIMKLVKHLVLKIVLK